MRVFFLFLALFLARPAFADDADAALGFPIWLTNYRTAAMARGLPAAWLDVALTGVNYLPVVVALDRAQPDDPTRRSVFADYLARHLTADRIEPGRTRMADNSATLRAVTAKTGVPADIIMGIWGMETSYGRVNGGFDLPSALATLAYDGRRADLFTRELDAAVRIIGEGRATRSQMRGSWAGALGQPQFLPSNYLKHGSDGDGDDRVDLWGSVPDTLTSIGKYLADNGWQPGLGWGFRVGVPADFDRASVTNPDRPTECIRPLEKHSRWLPVADWRARGLVPLNSFWPDDAVLMTLVEPDGPGTDAYLTSANYRVLLSYNCSNFYALSVALLGNAIAAPPR